MIMNVKLYKDLDKMNKEIEKNANYNTLLLLNYYEFDYYSQLDF